MNKQIAYKEKKINYLITGNGPVVVLLHGFGEDGTIWNNQVSFLEKEFTVVVPHLPGSGGSDLIEDMSMEGIAENVLFLLQSENIKECAMIGHSMGGYITLAFAEMLAPMLNSFGLFHSTAYADTDEKKATRQKGIAFIKEHGAYEFLKTTIPNLYSLNTKEQNSSLIDQHLRNISYFSNEALIAYYESMIQRPDRTHILEQNKMPILFVLGRGDNTVPLEQGLEQTHLPDTSYVHILEQSGHMGMQEEQKKSNNILRNFLLKTV